MRRNGYLVFVCVCFFSSSAIADFHYAVVVGEKSFVGREDRAYRATRIALTQCAAEFDPSLCKETQLQRVGGGWQSEVVGRKGFLGVDGDYVAGAERRAMDQCHSAGGLRSCRIERTSEEAAFNKEPRVRKRGIRIEDFLR